MVLELPGGLFGQQDVRETPADVVTAEANAFTFDTNDFTDTAGDISLKNKTSYWTTPGVNFTANNPDTDEVQDGANGTRAAAGTGITFTCPVELPHGAVVTGVIVQGNIGGTEAYTLLGCALDDDGSNEFTMATANINTEDTSISDATIDNSANRYFILTSSLDAGDRIYNARIKYTTDYD